jgi:hypothetical protein
MAVDASNAQSEEPRSLTVCKRNSGVWLRHDLIERPAREQERVNLHPRQL